MEAVKLLEGLSEQARMYLPTTDGLSIVESLVLQGRVELVRRWHLSGWP